MGKEKTIRILQAFVSNDKGGLTGYICQNYNWINRNEIQFDFLTYEKNPLDFEKTFIDMGAHFFHISSVFHVVNYMKELHTILSKNDYAAIHFNMSYANFVPILIAYCLNSKRIIIHSHSTKIDDRRRIVRFVKTCIHYVGKYMFKFIATDYLACSELAAQWMYCDFIIKSKNYHLAKNAIDISKYSYSPSIREIERNKLGILASTFVIGHIGRFTYQKNHEFLIEVFRKVVSKDENVILLLIGEGPEQNAIKKKAKKLGLESKVLFLGRREDVPNLLQAMDCFVLPSRFEGLGIAGIEAQAAGLPCIVSDQIPRELDQTGLVHFISLTSSVDIWVKMILSVQNIHRKNIGEKLNLCGYDIRISIEKMMKLYMQELDA
ncbi:glycosyltransferase [Megasphaera cerevisiae]|jgi:glycosyltransferase involved in cell wall biosynthesis|uniref:glycosyltransferase n=1 Tax=Megasphaera cerevisiae TaxID=39029 RepID=UPI000942E2CF|nr:glycosyltransferase [Megasphaera cerevisiae]OKY52546.1 group 1 glycosyl transferase [Megasphaera cerevisiae]